MLSNIINIAVKIIRSQRWLLVSSCDQFLFVFLLLLFSCQIAMNHFELSTRMYDTVSPSLLCVTYFKNGLFNRQKWNTIFDFFEFL